MTGQKLFEISLDLCGLREPDGTVPGDLDDLKQRAIPMINVLLAENEPLAARIEKRELSLRSISLLSQEIDLPELLVSAVLPYGLARLICLGDDERSAERFGELYSRARYDMLRAGRAAPGGISEVY